MYDCRNDADALMCASHACNRVQLQGVIDTSVVGLLARDVKFSTRSDRFFNIKNTFTDFCGNVTLEFEIAKGSWQLDMQAFTLKNVGNYEFKLGRISLQQFKADMNARMQLDTQRQIWTRRPLNDNDLAYTGLNALMAYAIWDSETTGQPGYASHWTRVKAGSRFMKEFYSV